MERNRKNSRMNEQHNNMRNDRSGRSMRAHQPAGREYENQYIGSEPRRGEYGTQHSERNFSSGSFDRSAGRENPYRAEMSRPQYGEYSRKSFARNDDGQFDSYSQEDSLSSPYRDQDYDNQRTFMHDGPSRDERRPQTNSRPFGRTQSFDSSYGYDEAEDGSYEHSQHDRGLGANSGRSNSTRGARPYSQMSSDWGRKDDSHASDYRLNGYSSSGREFQPQEEHHDSIDYGSRRLGTQQTFGTYGSDMNSLNGSRTSSQTSFRGKGPKGFKRSDDRIKEQVCDILEQDHHIDASDIDVDVNDGEVTLSGTVTSREDKRLAEELIQDCAGVHEVINNIRTSSRLGAQNQSASSRTEKTDSSARNERIDLTSQQNSTLHSGSKTDRDDEALKGRSLDKSKNSTTEKINQTRLS